MTAALGGELVVTVEIAVSAPFVTRARRRELPPSGERAPTGIC